MHLSNHRVNHPSQIQIASNLINLTKRMQLMAPKTRLNLPLQQAQLINQLLHLAPKLTNQLPMVKTNSLQAKLTT